MAIVNAERHAFGRRLKSARESRGILLRHIADSTKIKESLFVELECGDVSKWPEGIYRRAYLCSYLSAIGLAAQPVLAEFAQLFPDDTASEAPQASPSVQPPADAGPEPATLSSRAWIAVFDVTVVIFFSTLIAAAAGVGVRSVLPYVAIAYIAAGSLVFAQTIGANVQSRIFSMIRPPAQESPKKTQIARLVVTRQAPPVRRLLDVDFEEEVASRRASA
jgi:hypothetical protein